MGAQEGARGRTGPKRKSGARYRKERQEREEELRNARPIALSGLPPPPADDLQLQLWGARCAATLAYLVMTNPDAMERDQWRYAREYLATLGFLFPRAQVVKRMQKEIEKRKGQSEEEDLKSVHGIDPGPTGRFGGGKRQGEG